MFIDLFHLIIKTRKIAVLLTISALPLIVSANQVDKATSMIKRLDTRFSGMASTTKVGKMGLDSMNIFFETVQKKIPAIETLMRINSNGMVINEISMHQMDYKMRNVSEQKWFLHVKSTHSPYYGLNRDSSGNASFFWAWPIISDDSLFNGVISAKIKPSEILKMASVSDTTPITIIFNNTTVYKRNSPDNLPTKSDTLLLSKQSIIIIRSAAVSNTYIKKDSTRNSILNAGNDNSAVSGTTENLSLKTAHPAQDSFHEQAPSAPVVYKSDFIESASSERHSARSIIFAIVTTLLFLTGAFILLKRFKKVSFKKEFSLPEIDSCELDTAKIDTALLVQDETLDVVDILTPTFTETVRNKTITTQDSFSSLEIINTLDYEDETKAHHPEIFHESEQPVVFKEPDKQLDNTDPLEQKLRRELYMEIHNQIMQWVVGESARLSGRIEELNERLEKSENGSTPEIEQIRQEAQEISKEIELFKTHLTNKNQ